MKKIPDLPVCFFLPFLNKLSKRALLGLGLKIDRRRFVIFSNIESALIYMAIISRGLKILEKFFFFFYEMNM